MLSDDVDERVMELVASVEKIGRRHRRPDIAGGLGAGQAGLHRQFVVVQILHAVKMLRFLLEGH